MDLCLATLRAVSFYFLHSVSSLNQCRKFSCVTVVCKHFASYQGYPNYKWDLIWYTKGQVSVSQAAVISVSFTVNTGKFLTTYITINHSMNAKSYVIALFIGHVTNHICLNFTLLNSLVSCSLLSSYH
jgi:hypothetical protein